MKEPPIKNERRWVRALWLAFAIMLVATTGLFVYLWFVGEPGIGPEHPLVAAVVTVATVVWMGFGTSVRPAGEKRRVSAKKATTAGLEFGSAYGMAPAHRGFLREVGQWNFQEVTVDGSAIKVELNGNIILDTDLTTVTEFMGGSPHPGKDRTRGHFGFAGHNDPVEFRNIRIKELPETPKAD